MAVGHSLVWRTTKVTTDLSPETLSKAVKDPSAVVWLDLAGDDLDKQRQRLLRTFSLVPLTITTMADPDERARLVVTPGYAHVIAHGLAFDAETLGAATPKLDIVFGSNFVITAHDEPLPWLTALWEAARTGKTEDHVMSRGAP
jgi:magnesium transporter